MGQLKVNEIQCSEWDISYQRAAEGQLQSSALWSVLYTQPAIEMLGDPQTAKDESSRNMG